jgi:hypothetical protein
MVPPSMCMVSLSLVHTWEIVLGIGLVHPGAMGFPAFRVKPMQEIATVPVSDTGSLLNRLAAPRTFVVLFGHG